MASKKKDLEFFFNLQWKTKSSNGDDKANIVMVYDIPATTLDWNTFKSYILTNSGTTGDNVRVSYTHYEKEIFINSQHDFQLALYMFRKKARNGEIITLMLDRRDDKMFFFPQTVTQCADAQTQINPEAAHSDKCLSGEPPEWFKKYMKQFKQDVVQEITLSVVNAVSVMKIHTSPPVPPHHSRKCKTDSKRHRKNSELTNDKEAFKSLSESKLKKLEHKTLKVKEKRLALGRSSDSDAGRIANCPAEIPLSDDDLQLHATAISQHDATIPHMMGGETYMQQWEVTNSGKVPWTSETELRFAWGSQALTPVSKSVSCPQLQPGERGPISVLLEVPKTPGHYECYWHFYHRGCRFGNWLGCQVIVDPSPVKYEPQNILGIPTAVLYTLPTDVKVVKVKSEKPSAPLEEPESPSVLYNSQNNFMKDGNETKPLNNEEVKNISNSFEKLDINEHPDDTNCSSDTDNQSIISIADSNSSISSRGTDEFFFVPEHSEKTPLENIKQEPELSDDIEVIEHVNFANDNNNNNAEAVGVEQAVPAVENSPSVSSDNTVTTEAEENSGYAYVYFKGEKLAVSKKYLRKDYLETAEEAPNPHAIKVSENKTVKEEPCEAQTDIDNSSLAEEKPAILKELSNASESDQTKPDALSDISHCSAAGSCFSDVTSTNDVENKSRLFVFPHSCPGFEVINAASVAVDESIVELNGTKSAFNSIAIEQSEPISLAGQATGLTSQFNAEGINYTWPRASTSTSYTGISVPPYSPYGRCDPYQPQDCGKRDNMYYNNYYPSPYMYPPSNNWQQPNQINTPYHPLMNLSYSGESQNSEQLRNNGTPQNMNMSSPFVNTSNDGNSTPRTSYGAPVSEAKEEKVPVKANEAQQTVPMIPETLVTGAVNVASSAINTARSVLNMIAPSKEEPGKWLNGKWVTTTAKSKRETLLNLLDEMGFKNRDYNATLLNRYDDNIDRALVDLLSFQ